MQGNNSNSNIVIDQHTLSTYHVNTQINTNFDIFLFLFYSMRGGRSGGILTNGGTSRTLFADERNERMERERSGMSDSQRASLYYATIQNNKYNNNNYNNPNIDRNGNNDDLATVATFEPPYPTHTTSGRGWDRVRDRGWDRERERDVSFRTPRSGPPSPSRQGTQESLSSSPLIHHSYHPLPPPPSHPLPSTL